MLQGVEVAGCSPVITLSSEVLIASVDKAVVSRLCAKFRAR